MELRQMRYFVAVGEEQHYGRAAQRLRVAQPALSRQIQNLEEEIGFKLFERLPRGVKITAAGEFLLKQARAFSGGPGRVSKCETQLFRSDGHFKGCVCLRLILAWERSRFD